MNNRTIRDMTPSAHVRARPRQRVRRIAFAVWAALLAALLGSLFIGVTILTVGWWLIGRNQVTTPVTDLGFFALGALITGGILIQLRTPARRVAGIQQAGIGLLALGVAGLIGGRIEPLTGALVLLVATTILAALHPARDQIVRLGTHISPRLAALAIVAAIPAALYATDMLVQARQAGPSCFVGRCAYGDRFAELAALALAIVAAALLAASRPAGWRFTAWSVSAAAIVLGAVSLVLPALPGALGRLGGVLAIAWGILVSAVGEHEARRTAEATGSGPTKSP